MVKFPKKASSQIPTLKNGSDEVSSNVDKASLLNEVLSQNFNSAIPPLSDADSQHFMVNPLTVSPEDILCSEEEVLGLLLAIDTSKASGPDGISGKMLKNTALSISPTGYNKTVNQNSEDSSQVENIICHANSQDLN